MDRINGANTVDIGGGRRGFRDRNLLAGLSGTQVTAEFLNALQEEVLGVIEGAGLTPAAENLTQLRTAIGLMIAGQARAHLTAPLTLYVSPTGDDLTHDGLSALSPFRTIQKAWDTIAHKYDLNGQQVTIQLAPGTYNAGLSAYGSLTGQSSEILLRGDPVAPSNVVIDVANGHCIAASGGARLKVDGVRLLAAGTPGDYNDAGSALTVSAGAILTFSNTDFGACTNGHVIAHYGGLAQSGGAPYMISGGAPAHFTATAGGVIVTVDSIVTLSGTPAFSSAFAVATEAGILRAWDMAFGGSATGARYSVAFNGIIHTRGGGANFFPGSAAGSVNTGGQYI